ncbi:hypothetical protein [Janibacter melonis]|uniref:hypothetical protein n=1 Tax=Janibacter melonis TaxID=262209 RepID=UPI001781E447|nr:hypothetical protein [Janibacter melonis]
MHPTLRRTGLVLVTALPVMLATLWVSGTLSPASSTTPSIAGTDPVTNPARLGNESLSFGGCAVRFDTKDGSPRIHTNSSHYCVGVREIYISQANGRLSVRLVDRQPVIALSAVPDETLAGARGIMVGPSGGTSGIEYQFYDTKLGRPLDLRKLADRKRIKGSTSNLWISWVRAV